MNCYLKLSINFLSPRQKYRVVRKNISNIDVVFVKTRIKRERISSIKVGCMWGAVYSMDLAITFLFTCVLLDQVKKEECNFLDTSPSRIFLGLPLSTVLDKLYYSLSNFPLLEYILCYLPVISISTRISQRKTM